MTKTTKEFILEHERELKRLNEKARRLPKDDRIINTILRDVARANRGGQC